MNKKLIKELSKYLINEESVLFNNILMEYKGFPPLNDNDIREIFRGILQCRKEEGKERKQFHKTYNNMKEPLKIKVMYHDPELVRIEKIHIGDWIDLRCAEDVEMKQGDYKLLSLGVSIELPSGYEAHVLPRSSTYKNFGIILSNSQGIIDNTYKNSKDLWRFPAIAMRDTKINKNDRICQFRIVKNMEEVLIEEVHNLDHNDMRGGIGSTGIN